MCGKAPKTPQVVQRDPIAEQAAADAQAQRETNAQLATRRRRRQQNSLLTTGASGASAPTNSLLSQAQAGGT